MAQLDLYFLSGVVPQLQMTRFQHPLLPKERWCMRGIGIGALPADGTFHWSTAVKALCVLMLRTAGTRCADGAGVPVLLLGHKGSAAASLDYAIGKEPAWLCDLFGVDSNGNSLAPRIFKRINPEAKRPGPVAVMTNAGVLNADTIRIFMDNRQIADSATIAAMADRIEQERWPGNKSHGDEASGFFFPAMFSQAGGKALQEEEA